MSSQKLSRGAAELSQSERREEFRRGQPLLCALTSISCPSLPHGLPSYLDPPWGASRLLAQCSLGCRWGEACCRGVLSCPAKQPQEGAPC